MFILQARAEAKHIKESFLFRSVAFNEAFQIVVFELNFWEGLSVDKRG
jgi:hypothetical protein